MTRSAPYLRRKWLVVAWCRKSVAYLVTCAFPTISAMVEVVVEREKKKQLTLADRKSLYFMVWIEVSKSGHTHGLFKKVSENFRIAPRQASRVYSAIRKKVVAYLDSLDGEVSNTILLPDDLFKDGNENRGAKKKYCREKVSADVTRIPLKERSNVHDLARALNIPYTTVFRMRREGIMNPYKSYIKPKLTEANAEWRLDYAWSQVDQAQFLNVYATRGVLVYDKQYQVIHVNKKWFYLIKDGQKFYIAHDEKPPYISQQHKQSIPKVMFFCVLMRP